MATNDRILKRAYSISLPGATQSIGEIKKLEAAFESLRKKKSELNSELATSVAGKEAAATEALRAKIAALEKQMETLTKKRGEAGKEALNQARAEQALANARTAEARTATEQARAEQALANSRAADARAGAQQARADQARLASSVAQERELDRLIAQEERQRVAMQRTQQTVNAATGSYNALYREYRELYNLVRAAPEGSTINFRGQQQGYDEAIANLQRLATAEQNFRRQFSQDGLLVGEYTTGIVNAFRNAGLDDLITGQLTRAEAELERLNREFEETRQELGRVGVSGAGNLEVLERSLIENRQQAQQLETQLGGVRQSYRGVGDIGQRVTDSLRQGFSSLRQNLSQLVLSYVGFQAILTTTQSIFRDTVALDSQASALAVVSETSQELAVNQQYLAEVTDRLGLQILPTTSAFKGFYAASTQAGIGAEETRRIFESATSASSRLKLSQENTNGVLLAFGQIASKGKVQAEELRGQIGERIPGAFAIAARSIGVTQAELNKMLEQGQVIASDFLPKFATELQKTFGGDSTEKVEGLQASINRLKNQFTNMVAENQEGVSNFISGFIQGGSILLSIFSLLTGNLPLLISLLALYGTGWAIVNKELVIQKANLLLVNAQLIISRVGLGLAAIVQNAYTIALGLFTGATTLATAAMRIFNTTVAANPLGLFLTVLAVVFAAVNAFGAAVDGSTENLRGQARQLELNAEIQKEVTTATTAQISKIEQLTKVVIDNRLALQDRKQALADLIALNPSYLQGLTLENIRTRESIGLLRSYVTALQDKAKAEALAGARAKALQSKIENEQNASRAQSDPEFAKREYERLNPNNTFFKSVGSAIRYGTIDGEAASVAEYYQKEAKAQAEAIAVYDAQTTAQLLQSAANISATENKVHAETVAEKRGRLEQDVKNKKAAYDKLLATDTAGQKRNEEERKIIQAELDAIDGKADKEKKEKAYGGSKLTGGQKDAQRDAEAAKDAAIRTENRKFEDLKEIRALNEEDEVQHQRNLLKIETDALNKKLSSLSEKNATERKLAEELRDKKAELAGKTAQTIYEIEDDYAGRTFDQARKNAEDQLAVIRDSDTDALTQAEAQVAYLKKLEDATNAYFAAITTAAGNNKNAIALIEAQKAAALKDINRDSNRDVRRLQQARFEYEIAQLEKVRTLQEQILRTQTAQRRLAILQDPNLSPGRRQRSLDKLGDEAEVANLSNQININDREIAAFRKKYGVLSSLNKEYNELVTQNAELTANRQQKLNENEFKYATGAFKAREESLFSYLEKKLNLDDSEVQALQQGAQIAGQMLQNYFADEQARIDKKRAATQERLDLEKQELLGNAQSNAERAAIEKQFEAKKKQAERDAAKERQQLALQQLEIETALGIARTLASTPYPANIFLAAAEGLLFLQQRQRIKSQKFEYGGMPTGGGDIAGRRHSAGGTPFTFAGRDYEAEAGELAIINRNSAASGQRMTVSGTPRQIASAINSAGGGVSFAPGAAVRKYEYGGVLRAPNFSPGGYSSGSGTGSDLAPVYDAVSAQAYAIAAVANQVLQLEVLQVTSTVTSAQKKEVRNQSVATI